MNNRSLNKKIVKFYEDVEFLETKGLKHNEIGDRMPGVGKSNFSKYFNQENTITEEFLAKFYQTWGGELPKNTDYEKSKIDPAGGNIVEEPKRGYPRRNFMQTMLEKLVEGQNTIARSNVILAEANKILAETNRNLFDRLPGIPPPSKTHTEPSKEE